MVVSLVAGMSWVGFGQSFWNLGFESASLVPVPGTYSGEVQPGPALPGWQAFWGASAPPFVLYDNMFLDSAGLSILDTNAPYGFQALNRAFQGRFTVLLQGGFSLDAYHTNRLSAAIAQTGMIPAGTKTLAFDASPLSTGATNFVVSVAGQNLPFYALGFYGNYVLYEADLSSFSGQVAELRFTAYPNPPPGLAIYNVFLDDIRLSTTPLALPPIILAPPQSQTANQSSTVDFTVSANGPPPLVYEWFFNRTNALSGQTNSNLHLANLQLFQSGTYTVVVTNICGAATSLPATLNVIGSFPTILRSPRSQTAIIGSFAEFTVSAGSVLPLTYQWFFNGGPILGASGTSLHLSNVQFSQSGTYHVVVTNALGAVTSSAAVLTVLALPTLPSGTVVPWGDNSHGQCAVPAGLSNVIAVAPGYYHSLALKSDSTVVAWGDDPGQGESHVPPGLTNVVAIAAGWYYSLALKTDGTVVAWGGGGTVPTGLGGVVAIAGGYAHCLALKSDGSVVAWGYNEYGQCTVPAGLSDVIAVAAGYNHSLALKSDGTVVAWGAGGPGQFGGANFGQSTVPVGLGNVISLAGGGYHNLALKSDGTVVAWGDNYDSSANFVGQATVPAGLAGVVGIAAGRDHSLALKSNGTVVAWGDNTSGQCAVPVALRGAIAVATEGLHNLALVAAPPIVQIPPATQTAEIGSTVRFQVRAAGYSPMTYQWFFNGTTRLGNGTSAALVLANVQPTQTGAYTVVITNIAGAVTSPPALLNVIPPVERRIVPAITLAGQSGVSLHLENTSALDPFGNWVELDTVILTNPPQFYFDLTAPLPSEGYYRAWQSEPLAAPPTLNLHFIPAITLAGAIGSSVRVDYINQFGPTDAWVTLDTITLTSSPQLYFDTSVIGQPARLYRVVPLP